MNKKRLFFYLLKLGKNKALPVINRKTIYHIALSKPRMFKITHISRVEKLEARKLFSLE